MNVLDPTFIDLGSKYTSTLSPHYKFHGLKNKLGFVLVLILSPSVFKNEYIRLMPRSHRTFRPVPTMKLLEIMLRSKCQPTTFHTITTGDVGNYSSGKQLMCIELLK